MKKVFIIHGYQGMPNGGWRPYLMRELAKNDIYACSLSMPTPFLPRAGEWVEEISRHVSRDDQIILVGHSLGVPAILRHLESSNIKIDRAVLVSGPCKALGVPEIKNFLDKEFKWEKILANCKNFTIIHGDNDNLVPLNHAEELSKKLDGNLVIIKNGGHLNSDSGWNELPEARDAVIKMF